MKIKAIVPIVLCNLLLWLHTSSHAQHFLKAEGKVIVNEVNDTVLLRGMGLGGWMLQEGYMLQTAGFANAQHEIKERINELVGAEKTEQFYNAWLQNHVTKNDVDSLKAWGFNSVRLPMHYNLYTLPIEEEPIQGEDTWLNTGFELTDSLISWCKQNQMYVILDLHAAPGGQGQDMGISDYDPDKPSLWESNENKRKTVALWLRLAERYKDEQWVAGYDLLNETNWNLGNNKALADLYKDITTAVRGINDNHIIFIEGNWFANDFTGLTPPWDDNLVYSPHKYWSINDQASIQWVLDLRDNYNVPLYLGESGENSNVWFRDAIALLESENIGWAWWPMKKIEAIAGPTSVIKKEGYQSLLDYWSGSGQRPSEEEAFQYLMEVTDLLKIENCKIQYDVIDAMFRQVQSNDTKPFTQLNIPGVIHATDYDLGRNGYAYYDNEAATYHVSTGQYTAWNNGWQYRNDGVDIEQCSDPVNSNGYNIGWTEAGEWLQYEVNVLSNGYYDIELRVATETGGKIRFEIDGVPITNTTTIPSTGAWDQWQTIIINNVLLDTKDSKLRLYIDEASLNINSLEFLNRGSSQNIGTRIVQAITQDETTLQLSFNKHLEDTSFDLSTFTLFINDEELSIESANFDASNKRIIYFDVEQQLLSTDRIQITYDGDNIQAQDGIPLTTFIKHPVINTLDPIFTLPGRLQAEDYFFQTGISLETTTDIGGGENIGFLDAGDYLEYKVYVPFRDTFAIGYRIASEIPNGESTLLFIDQAGTVQHRLTTTLPSTGGWQSWTSVEDELLLNPGLYTLRLEINKGPFNINWIQFEGEEEEAEPNPKGIAIFPNPASGYIHIRSGFDTPHNLEVRFFNAQGQFFGQKEYNAVTSGLETIDVSQLPSGLYLVRITLENNEQYDFKIIKQ